MALVASTHPGEALSRSPIPLWFGDQGWENYAQLLTEGSPAVGGVDLSTMLLNSFIMAIGITVGKIAISLISAFAIVYFRFPFRMLFFWLIFITLMLPVEVRILPTYDVVASLGMLNQLLGSHHPADRIGHRHLPLPPVLPHDPGRVGGGRAHRPGRADPVFLGHPAAAVENQHRGALHHLRCP